MKVHFILETDGQNNEFGLSTSAAYTQVFSVHQTVANLYLLLTTILLLNRKP